jgi:predicted aspartyl protease
MAFDPSRGLIAVPARFRGPSGEAVARLALDTGATSSMVRTAIPVSIGYDPALAVERVRVTTGSGVEYVPQVRVDELEAMGNNRMAFDVLAHTLPPTAAIDGLLGLDFLRGQRLLVDFREGFVELT